MTVLLNLQILNYLKGKLKINNGQITDIVGLGGGTKEHVVSVFGAMSGFDDNNYITTHRIYGHGGYFINDWADGFPTNVTYNTPILTQAPFNMKLKKITISSNQVDSKGVVNGMKLKLLKCKFLADYVSSNVETVDTFDFTVADYLLNEELISSSEVIIKKGETAHFGILKISGNNGIVLNGIKIDFFFEEIK